MKKNRAFVPGASPLEDRIALSGGISALDVQPPTTTANGTPVLTSSAFHRALHGVDVSYSHFHHDAYSYGRLNNDLNLAVNPIPFSSTDGLTTTLSNDVAALRFSFGFGPANGAVAASKAQVIADIKGFVASEVAAGRFIFVK
jgi:hypothetical protein